jgi:pimeloyl-ACP methyl ester carboxylesterase
LKKNTHMIASKLASLLESLLTRLSAWHAGALLGSALPTLRVTTPAGCVQVFASGAVSVVQGLGHELPALQAGALGDVKVPCTLVWGTQDRSHRPEGMGSLATYLPHATKLEFEDCGHFPDVEQAQRFAQLVLRLVD